MTTNPHTSTHKQHGLSLVEIMVAVTLSMVLAIGIGQIYVANKQSYRLQDAQGRIQENGRYALEVIAKDVRQAGYQGCAPRSINGNVVAKAPPTTLTVSAATAIGGNDSATATTTLSPSGTALTNVIPGTDVVSVQFGEACGGRVAYTMGCDASSAVPCPTTSVSKGGEVILATNNICKATASTGCGGTGCNQDIYLISDCKAVDLFRASSVRALTDANSPGGISHSTTTNSNANLNTAYDTSAELMIFRSYAYYLRNGESGLPALFRYDLTKPAGGNNPIELVEGVENMQILYGIDPDRDRAANQYVTAASVTDWGLVASVRVDLTLRSVGESADNVTMTGDKRLRRTFSTTIGLRNAL